MTVLLLLLLEADEGGKLSFSTEDAGRKEGRDGGRSIPTVVDEANVNVDDDE